MLYLTLDENEPVVYQGRPYKVKSALSLNKILLVDNEGKTLSAAIHKLQPLGMLNNEAVETVTNDFMGLSAHEWQELKTREKYLKELLSNKQPTLQLVKEVAKELHLRWRQVYNLLKNYRNAGSCLSGIVTKKKRGGAGKPRLSPEVEVVVQDAIQELYCNQQRFKISHVVEEINIRCRQIGVKPPSQVTVRNRITELPKRAVVMAREGSKAGEAFTPIVGATPLADYPLQVVQMDHTLVDLIIVDELNREPIGRPYLTIAIDLYSRCITGFCLSLEPPSATSVGLCLLHAVFDKEGWLSNMGIEGSWPIWGKPDVMYVDNASEFHSEALARGCDFHGIKIEYRPIGEAHYGGVVERVIGTLMQLVHKVPGTTFSNVQERGRYNSEKLAIMTLRELEKWLAIAIVNYYHQKIHSSLLMPPIEKYRLGILGDGDIKGRGYPKMIADKKAFLIDFLPIERRRLRRQGFVLNHIAYYSNVLNAFIYRKRSSDQYLIRRDPRDLSRIYVLDPESNLYLEIPYRNLARPTITLWEHKQALRYLQKKGRIAVDESLIFTTIEELRNLIKEDASKSKRARRNRERALTKTDLFEKSIKEEKIDIGSEEEQPYVAEPFKELEIW